MREILFRGKRLDNGEWFFGSLLVEGFLLIGGDVREIVVPKKGVVGCFADMYPIDPKTVGQYTGLKDKNDEMIFEGDVVKGHHYINRNKKRIVGSVRFVSDGWHIEGVKQYEYVTTRLTPAFEVIGNIHDKPELLEVLGEDE